MKNILKNIRKTALNIILWLSVLSALFMLIGSIFKNEKQLSPWGTGFFTVLTGSMTPAISPGSVIFVIETPAENIKINDILTFYDTNKANKSDDIITTHRVTGIERKDSEHFYITRGDANNIDDLPVSYKNVIGRVIFSLPFLGFLPVLFRNPVFIGGLIITAGIGIIFRGIKDLRKKQSLISIIPVLLLISTVNIAFAAKPSGAWWHINGRAEFEYTIGEIESEIEPEDEIENIETDETDEAKENEESEKNEDFGRINPKTGDGFAVALSGLMIICGCAIIFIREKRGKNP